MELTCCYGNYDDVRTSFKVLPNNCVTNVFIVCPHDQLQFFVIFHHLTSTTTMKNPYEPP